MSIVKMKKLRLIALQSDRDKMLRELLMLGCVEISETADKLHDPDWSALVRRDESAIAELRRQADSAAAALSTLNKYVPAKSGLFAVRREISSDQFFSDTILKESYGYIDEINDLESHIKSLISVESQLKSIIASLLPWSGLDVPLETTGSGQAAAFFGTIPSHIELDDVDEELSEKIPEAQLFRSSTGQEQHAVLLICHGSVQSEALALLRIHGFSIVTFKEMRGTASENIKKNQKSLEEALDQAKALQEQISGYSEHRDNIKLAIDRLGQELAQSASVEKLLRTDMVFALEGWVSEPELTELTKLLSAYDCAWDFSDPEPEEYPDVPVKLKNNKVTAPLMAVTQLYSLPAYDGIDPNPLIMPFFTLFFGMMYGDLGYGILLLIIGIVGSKKIEKAGTMKLMCQLMILCGITTSVFGVLFGSFFGDAIPVIQELLGFEKTELWSLINPLDNAIQLLFISLALGIIQILVGMGIKAYMNIRDGDVAGAIMDTVSYWLLFGGVALGALGITWWVAVAGLAALVLTQGREKPTIIGKFIGGLSSLYDLINLAADILSYSRLMALLLASSVIASVFNVLGSLAGNVIVFIPIFLFGHALNMGINLIGTFVHAARLQYIEYFGKFYKDGGREFSPLAINTKYVKIIKEEK